MDMNSSETRRDQVKSSGQASCPKRPKQITTCLHGSGDALPLKRTLP
ncbi:hypothetical protein QTP86_034272, partial [Hemibagrus guttatus]